MKKFKKLRSIFANQKRKLRDALNKSRSFSRGKECYKKILKTDTSV